MVKRDLTATDQRLWRHVTRNVKSIHRSSSAAGDSIAAEEPIHSATRPLPSATKAAMKGISATPSKAAHDMNQNLGPVGVGAVSSLDRSNGKKLIRGKYPVDGKIDLHGMSLSQAHSVLCAFINRSYAKHDRCVVVITGKGRKSEHGGKIRAELVVWLNQPSLRSKVVAVVQANIRDGGSGAFYVLLKRHQQK
jgi:DNA-nicking Smr family endonuclease